MKVPLRQVFWPRLLIPAMARQRQVDLYPCVCRDTLSQKKSALEKELHLLKYKIFYSSMVTMEPCQYKSKVPWQISKLE